jgi:putative toxin-antitoxin system antitoxin component (TIGR02293 family)
MKPENLYQTQNNAGKPSTKGAKKIKYPVSKSTTEGARQELNEPEAMFNHATNTKRNFLKPVNDQVILISLKGKPEYKMTSFEKMELSEDGISKKALQNLKDKAQLDYNQLSRVLNVARATLINKKGNEKFSRDVSDKILGLADIYSYGYEVFEDMNRFNEWVFRENLALGGKTPFDLLHNTFGREEVKHLIGRIDYGVYS